MFYVFEKPQLTGTLYGDPNSNEIITNKRIEINSIFILDGIEFDGDRETNIYHVYVPQLMLKGWMYIIDEVFEDAIKPHSEEQEIP